MKVIEGEEPCVKSDTQEDPLEEKRLHDIIDYADKKGLQGMKSDAEKQLESLKKSITSSIASLQSHAKTVKEVLNEKIRLLTNHEAKTKAIHAKPEKSIDAAKKHQEAKDAAIKEEKERHAKTMTAINADFDRMLEVAAKTAEDKKEELIQIEALFESEVEKLDKYIALNSAASSGEPEEEEELSTPAITPQMMNVEKLRRTSRATLF